MTERLRITSIKPGETLSGKPVVELYGDTRLRHPVLRLFDASMLITVGINPNALDPAQKTTVALWAYYELSDKLNEKGNPYKDIVHLERIGQPATATSVDNSAILAELRAIKALLLELVSEGSQTPEIVPESTILDPDQDRARRVAALSQVGSNGDPVSKATGQGPQTTDPPAETPPMTQAEARTEFYALCGPAIAAGTLPVQTVNDLVNEANGSSWPDVLAKLITVLEAAR